MEEKTVKKPMRKPARRKVCAFCAEKVEVIDYKDVNRLKKYVTEGGKILPRRTLQCHQKSAHRSPSPLQRRVKTQIVKAPYLRIRGFLRPVNGHTHESKRT